MAKTLELQRFYAQKAWSDLRWMLVIQRHGICERCGKSFANDTSKLIGHHKIELTEETLSDPQIALNPDNVELLCISCHSHQHRTGFSKPRQVFIIWGAPLSGKSTYVREQMERGDLIVDIDSIAEAISGCERYDRPEELKQIYFMLRDTLHDAVKMRVGNWSTAYIIGGYPRRDERQRLATRLGAECIEIESTKDDCYSHLEKRFNKDDNRYNEWKSYIDKWFEDVQR